MIEMRLEEDWRNLCKEGKEKRKESVSSGYTRTNLRAFRYNLIQMVKYS